MRGYKDLFLATFAYMYFLMKLLTLCGRLSCDGVGKFPSNARFFDQSMKFSLYVCVAVLQREGVEVWEAGFGSLYWMEGVVVRMQV